MIKKVIITKTNGPCTAFSIGEIVLIEDNNNILISIQGNRFGNWGDCHIKNSIKSVLHALSLYYEFKDVEPKLGDSIIKSLLEVISHD